MEIEGADVGISAYEAYGQVSKTKEEADRLEAAYDQDMIKISRSITLLQRYLLKAFQFQM
jgi:hypothetical protein